MIPISIVICTIENSGREDRLAEVIEHLRQQRGVDPEIILVWQGNEDGAVPRPNGVRVLVTDLCSSGESRNRGADIAHHDLIAFYDDDTYPVGDDLLVRAVALLNERKLDFLTCNIRSSGRVRSSAPATIDIDLSPATLIANMWEPGLLIRRDAFAATRFDETLGIGCLHGSSEGFDFGARLMAKGFRGQRIASLLIDHPPLTSDARVSIERTFFYSLGNAASLVERKYYGELAFQFLKTLGRLAISLATLDGEAAKRAWVRLLCFMLGPLLPRRPARMLPPGHAARPVKILEPEGKL